MPQTKKKKGGKSQEKVAKQFGISGRQYEKIKKVYYEAPKKVKEEWKP